MVTSINRTGIKRVLKAAAPRLAGYCTGSLALVQQLTKRDVLNLTHWRDVIQRFAGQGLYPHELAFLLDNPLRRLLLSPRKLANRFHLTPHSQVLELGSGPGFFSVEVARRIPDGFLVLFDIQCEMLQKGRKKLIQAGVKNFHLVQGSAVRLPFSPRVFDVVFMVTVLGEVSQPQECLNRIHHVLRPGGLLSITEMRGDPDALSQSDLLQLTEKNGFQLSEQFVFFGGFTLNLLKLPVSDEKTG